VRLVKTEIHQLLEASHARGRETILAKRVLLDALATMLIQHEVVDHNALDRLLATPVSEEVASALVPG
jgi:ATP-dependent Zn protease